MRVTIRVTYLQIIVITFKLNRYQAIRRNVFKCIILKYNCHMKFRSKRLLLVYK